jgi:hypothetical protein
MVAHSYTLPCTASALSPLPTLPPLAPACHPPHIRDLKMVYMSLPCQVSISPYVKGMSTPAAGQGGKVCPPPRLGTTWHGSATCPAGTRACVRSDLGSMGQPQQLSEGVGEAAMETAQKQALGHQPLPLAHHIRTGPRWPGSLGLPRCGPKWRPSLQQTDSRATMGKPQQVCLPQLARVPGANKHSARHLCGLRPLQPHKQPPSPSRSKEAG